MSIYEDYFKKLSEDDQRSTQNSLNQGAKPEDVMNWWEAKKAGVAGVGEDSQSEQDKRHLSELLGMYGGSGDKAGYTSNDIGGREDSMQLLEAAKKYDPNATLSENGLVFDKSKLPASKLGDMSKYSKGGSGNFHDYYSRLENGHGVGGGDINDASKVIHDPVYGDYIAKKYMGQGSGDSTSGFMGQMGKYMPAVVSAVMAAGMGAAAGPMMGGLLSSGLGPGGVADKLSMGEPVDWKQTAINGAMGVGGGLLSGASGLDLSKYMKMYQLAQMFQNRGNNNG